MKITNRFISLALAIVLIISLAAPAFAADYYYPKYNGSGGLVDGLNAVGAPSSFAEREKIAEANGVTPGTYRGSAEQNNRLLDLLRCGQLKKPGGQASNDTAGNIYFPQYKGIGGLVDGLNAVGVPSSFSAREKIAEANGVAPGEYRGTAEQNNRLLDLLRCGQLKKPGAEVSTSASNVFSGTTGGVKNGITVTKQNTPLRATADGKADVILRAKKGAVLEVVGTARTGFMGCNKWYRVLYGGSEYYVFADNVKIHEHKYTAYSAYGADFRVCDCGHVVYTTYQHVEIKRASDAAVLGVAAVSAAVDGPIPLGDIIGVAIVTVATIEKLTGKQATADEVKEVAFDLDYVEYLKNSKNECTKDSYRMVLRTSPNLTFLSDACLTLGEAFVYVRCCNGDVWCADRNVAEALATLEYFGCYYEHDKHAPTHYWHYHLGANADGKVGGHIFYGKNDLGQLPS